MKDHTVVIHSLTKNIVKNLFVEFVIPGRIKLRVACINQLLPYLGCPGPLVGNSLLESCTTTSTCDPIREKLTNTRACK